MSNTVIIATGMLFLFGICGLAIWKGDAPERWSAYSVLVTWLVATGCSTLLREDIPLIVLSCDGVLATALLFISIQYASLWLGGAMLVQSSAFALHAWYLTVEPSSRVSYILTLNLLSYAVLILLLGATLNRWFRRLKRQGTRRLRSGAPRPALA